MGPFDYQRNSMYAPAEPEQQGGAPWWAGIPSMQPPAQGVGQGGGQNGNLLSAIGPVVSSMFAPSQGGGNQPASAPPTQTGGVPQPSYNLGPEGGDDLGKESETFASGLGQGVLAASQSAAAQAQKKKGMGGMGGAMGGSSGGGGGMGAGFGSGGIMGGSV